MWFVKEVSSFSWELTSSLQPKPSFLCAHGLCSLYLMPFGVQVNEVTLLQQAFHEKVISNKDETPEAAVLCINSKPSSMCSVRVVRVFCSPRRRSEGTPTQRYRELPPIWQSDGQEMDSTTQRCLYSQISLHPWAQCTLTAVKFRAS